MAAIPTRCLSWARFQATARTLGLAVVTSEIRRAEDIVPAFEALKGRADGIYVVADPLMFSNGSHPHLRHGRAATAPNFLHPSVKCVTHGEHLRGLVPVRALG